MSLFQEGYKLYYKQMVDMCIFRNYFHFLSVPCISVFLQLRFPQLKFMLIYSVFFFSQSYSAPFWKGVEGEYGSAIPGDSWLWSSGH